MSWVFTIIALAGTVLNVNKLRLCFILWAIANIGFGVLDFQRGDYGRLLLDIVQLLLAVWGYIYWGKDSK